MILYHGTNCDFNRFDEAKIRPYNVGLHFGTLSAAQARLDYLREHGAKGPFHLIQCRLDIHNPFRIEDVFGHSYALILDALQQALDTATLMKSPLHAEVSKLIDEYMGIEDDQNRAPGTAGYDAYCHRLDADVVRIFSTLGYDGLVYENKIEDADSEADSYVAFAAAQVSIIDRRAA